MAMDWGLVMGRVFALGDDGEDDIPQDDERYGIPLAGNADYHGASNKEDVLDAVGAPGEVFEVELEREHGEFADHEDVGEERDGYQQEGKDRIFCAELRAVVVLGETEIECNANPYQGVGRDGESEERMALPCIEVEFCETIGSEEGDEKCQIT